MYKELFTAITFGKPQFYRSIAAIPLSAPTKPGALEYLTLSEALSLSLIRIEEVSEGGSVPELRVVSAAAVPVLIVAGEELKGARQNRILNTSILVPSRGSLIIPVSCTERGRWSYVSPDFKDSGNISNTSTRAAAASSSYYSLEAGRGHHSDQGAVWDRIEELHSRSHSSEISHTRAMDDAFRHRAVDLDEARRHFRLITGQTGILFFHGGKAAGLDIVSRPAAYARLHEKFIGSYVIDCLNGEKEALPAAELLSAARRFLRDITHEEPKSFPSPGLGFDYRIRSAKLHASLLALDNESIHACCFSISSGESPRFAGYAYRRDH
jgi:hypothetical protein